MNKEMYLNDVLKSINAERKKKVVTFRCNPIVLARLINVAKEKNVSVSSLVDSIVTDWWCNL